MSFKFLLKRATAGPYEPDSIAKVSSRKLSGHTCISSIPLRVYLRWLLGCTGRPSVDEVQGAEEVFRLGI